MTRARNVADIIKQPFTTTLGTSNYRAGVNAGNSITANTNFNVCIGDEAGTALNGGDENVFVGYNAGLANSTGSSNVAIGRAALVGNVGGTRNTAIGDASLASASGSDNNVAVGRASGLNCTGGNNTFIGTDAGEMATSADSSTFVGAFAGQGITGAKLTGNQNTAVGAQAGLVLQGAATDNSLLGFGAGKAINTAVGNTLLGVNAGDTITTGSNNVIIGISCDVATGGVANAIVIGDGVGAVGGGNFTFGNGTSDTNIAFANGAISNPSDQRYKEDIVTSTAGLSFIKDLRPVTFKWKKEKDIPSDHREYVEGSNTRVQLSTGEINHGFIAQEVKAVIDAHSEIKDGFSMWSEQGETGGRQRLSPTALIPMLVKAIQELEARIATLEG